VARDECIVSDTYAPMMCAAASDGPSSIAAAAFASAVLDLDEPEAPPSPVLSTTAACAVGAANTSRSPSPTDGIAAKRRLDDNRWFVCCAAVKGSSAMSTRTRACISTTSSLGHTIVGGPLSGTGSTTENALWLFSSRLEHAVLHVGQIAFLHTQGCKGLLIKGQRLASWSLKAHPRHLRDTVASTVPHEVRIG